MSHTPPPDGLWRVARATNPLQPSWCSPEEESSPSSGNRFDTADFGVLYFGTLKQCCFGETLARFRPDPELARLVANEWNDLGWMAPGQVPAEWRHRRTLVFANVRTTERFLDIESAITREYLRGALALGLSALGATDLDVPTVRGGDRRVTRLISKWAYHQIDSEGNATFAGIRYVSRLNSEWECWAAFTTPSSIPPEP